jgi:hypothetical protein
VVLVVLQLIQRIPYPQQADIDAHQNGMLSSPVAAVFVSIDPSSAGQFGNARLVN